jgi:RND family efflux transporter MFP subunit
MSDPITTPEKPKKTSILTYIIAGMVVLAGIVYLFYQSIEKRKHMAEEAANASKLQIQSVRVVKPTQTADTAVILLPGSIRGFRETSLFARVSGYVKNWYVDIGDHVQEGQLLTLLETPELDQQLLQAKANLELAKTSLDRVKNVNLEGAVSVQQIADRDGAYKAALAAFNQLEAQKSFKRVLAPFPGIITSRNIDIGSLVNAGSSMMNQLFTIAEINRLRIFVNVPQTFVSSISVGSKAKVIVQEVPGKPIIGVVTRTAGALDPVSRTLLVQVEFPNSKHTYLPGMFGRVRFVVKRKTRPFIIPANTLVIASDGPKVYTVTPENTILIKSIGISQDHGATLEISEGLTGDEKMVTNPNLKLTPGLKVEIATN